MSRWCRSRNITATGLSQHSSTYADARPVAPRLAAASTTVVAAGTVRCRKGQDCSTPGREPFKGHAAQVNGSYRAWGIVVAGTYQNLEGLLLANYSRQPPKCCVTRRNLAGGCGHDGAASAPPTLFEDRTSARPQREQIFKDGNRRLQALGRVQRLNTLDPAVNSTFDARWRNRPVIDPRCSRGADKYPFENAESIMPVRWPGFLRRAGSGFGTVARAVSLAAAQASRT